MFNKSYKSALLALLFILPFNAHSQDLLFEYTGNQPSFDASSNDGAVVSRHSIKFNRSALKNNFRFKLPNGKSVKVRLESRKKVTNKLKYEVTTYRGYVKEHSKKLGTFEISLANDENGNDLINGMLRSKDGSVFLLKQRDAKSQELLQIDESKQIECSSSPRNHLASSKATTSHSHEFRIKTDTTITLLVAYTPDAITTAGSEAALQTIIASMVSNANLAHANSHTGITYSLIATHALSQNSSDDFGDDLSAATNLTDGKWDDLGSLREEYCADQVSVIVGGTNGEQFCGIAWLGGNAEEMQSLDYLMYSIVSANQTICSYLTFAHELAHNLGSAHDYENSGNTHSAAYNYSYGYRFTGSSGQQFRTVMAYFPGTRVPYFSNPSISYDGTATGNSSANNAQSLSLTGPVAANFYGSGPTCADHTPITTPPGSGSPGVPTAVPTTLPATEPDTVLLSAKTKNGQTNFKIQALSEGAGIKGVPVTLYYDKTGFGGFTKQHGRGNTNKNGIKKITKKRKKGYYLACYSSTCSSANFY